VPKEESILIEIMAINGAKKTRIQLKMLALRNVAKPIVKPLEALRLFQSLKHEL
jgi:hypothetical protein